MKFVRLSVEGSPNLWVNANNVNAVGLCIDQKNMIVVGKSMVHMVDKMFIVDGSPEDVVRQLVIDMMDTQLQGSVN